VVNYGIPARCHSVVGRNVVFLTRRYACLINLFLVNYCCVMLIVWLAIYQQLLVMKLALHTLQWYCYAYVNTHGNLVTKVPTACLFEVLIKLTTSCLLCSVRPKLVNSTSN